jgi:hypothetical protein
MKLGVLLYVGLIDVRVNEDKRSCVLRFDGRKGGLGWKGEVFL